MFFSKRICICYSQLYVLFFFWAQYLDMKSSYKRTRSSISLVSSISVGSASRGRILFCLYRFLRSKVCFVNSWHIRGEREERCLAPERWGSGAGSTGARLPTHLATRKPEKSGGHAKRRASLALVILVGEGTAHMCRLSKTGLLPLPW